MNKHLIILGIVVLLIAVGLSGCIQETPVSEGDVNFSIEEVVATSELEVKRLFSDDIKLEVSNDTKFIIISITIENKEDKWLTVQSSFQSLTDNEGNKYDGKMFVEINDSTYAVEELVLINEEEALGLSDDISPASTQLKKTVYAIPIDKEPYKIELSYGFKANELANVEKWYYTYLEL